MSEYVCAFISFALVDMILYGLSDPEKRKTKWYYKLNGSGFYTYFVLR